MIWYSIRPAAWIYGKIMLENKNDTCEVAVDEKDRIVEF